MLRRLLISGAILSLAALVAVAPPRPAAEGSLPKAPLYAGFAPLAVGIASLVSRRRRAR